MAGKDSARCWKAWYRDGKKHSCHRAKGHSGRHHSSGGLSWGGLLGGVRSGTACQRDCG